MDETQHETLLHIALPIGMCNFLKASDVPTFMGQVNKNENRSKNFN